jgi:hypothetical protein
MTTAEFLVMLANDREELDAFREDPVAYLNTRASELGLSPEQVQVLTAGRLVDIRYMVEADFEVSREDDSEAAAETTTVGFVRPVWFRPVWFRKSSDESSDEPPE